LPPFSPFGGGKAMEKQLTMYQNLKEKYYRRKARRKLISQYEYVLEVDKIMEEYLTEKLVQGGSEEFMAKGRADLANSQAKVKTDSEFIQFLKRI